LVLANQISNFRLVPRILKTVKTAKAKNFLSNIILLQVCLAKKYPEAGSVILLYLTKYTYCESCWLFADRKHSYFKSNWINGIDDWQHLTLKINKHESAH